MTTRMPVARPDESLIHALRVGSAGVGIRLLASVAGALMTLAFTSALAFTLGAFFPPDWLNTRWQRGIFISPVAGVVAFFSGLFIYLVLVCWIWTRKRDLQAVCLRGRMPLGVWAFGACATVAVGLLVLAICESIAGIPGESEILVFATVCAAGGLTLLMWIRLYLRTGARPLHDESGVTDVRCPECQYSMVGLTHARCPECGREYTLDELMGRQNFEALRQSQQK